MDTVESFQPPSSSSLEDWLASEGLAHLAPTLRAQDIAEDVLDSLTESDLIELGISMGDRKRLMRAIARAAHTTQTAHAAHAELRQLTIMFCDLVDATALSARLSPEAWRDVVLAYQQTAVAVIARHGGSVAQYLGDGLLVYFGHPRAMEDAAVRAVHAALELVQAISGVMAALRSPGMAVTGQESVPPLRTRIGVHTGMVVIGDVGAGGHLEQLALGEAPHIAARLQEMAMADTVLITDSTYRLAAGAFDCQPLGQRVFKGLQAPRPVWRVERARAAPSRFDARTGGHGLTPLVGRAQELALLLDRWQAASQGQGQVVLISGEAGMGKSRIVQTARERLGEAGLRAWCWQCTEQARADDGLQGQLEAALAQAAREPVLVVFEDVQWADEVVLAALTHVVAQARDRPILVLVTHRLAFEPSFGPQPHVTSLKIPGLRRDEVATMVATLMGVQTLPPGMAQQILRRTDGVPLFVEELTRAWLEQGPQAATAGAGRPSFDTFVPATLRDSLMARMEHHPGTKALACIGAAIGREFGHEVLQRVWGRGQEGVLLRGIQALVDAGLLWRYDGPDGLVYVFRHALVQEAAYDALPASRKVVLHARILDALRDCHPDIAKTQPALLARHATAAGLVEVALALWLSASEQAFARRALHEAAQHMQNALQACAALPPGPLRDGTQRRLLCTLALVHAQGKGWATIEVGEICKQACGLTPDASDVDADAEARWRPWWGLGLHHLMRGDIALAQDLGRRMDEAGKAGPGAASASPWSAAVLAGSHLYAARFADVLAVCERAADALAMPQAGLPHDSTEPVFRARVHRLHAEWILGRVDDLDAACAEIEQDAERSCQPAAVAWVHVFTAMVQLQADQPEALMMRADRGLRLAQAEGLACIAALAMFARGWCQSRLDDIDEGIAVMDKALAACRSAGLGLMQPAFLALMAEALARAGQHARAIGAMDEAGRLTASGGEHWHEAERHRLLGALHLLAPEPDRARARQCFQQARDTAASQGASRWLLRAQEALAALPA